MSVEKNGVWTKFRGGPQRHRRLNSKFPRFVTRRGYHSALVRPSAHYQWFSAQRRTVQQFHRNEEWVHIHMQNRSFRRQRYLCRISVNRAKPCQLRHASSVRSVPVSNNRRKLLARLGFFAAFGGDDARDGGEVVGDTDVGPVGSVEERLDGGKGIVAEFEDQDPAGLEKCGGLGDEVGVEFLAFFAPEQSDGRFVVADFAGERWRFAMADVGRVADDQLEEW